MYLCKHIFLFHFKRHKNEPKKRDIVLNFLFYIRTKSGTFAAASLAANVGFSRVSDKQSFVQSLQ